MNYKADSKVVNKITITISRQQLWYNYMDSFTELMWIDPDSDVIEDRMKVVFNVLCFRLNRLNREQVTNLFRGGCAVALLHGVKEFNPAERERDPDDVFEIVITDGKNPNIVIGHNDIVF